MRQHPYFPNQVILSNHEALAQQIEAGASPTVLAQIRAFCPPTCTCRGTLPVSTVDTGQPTQGASAMSTSETTHTIYLYQELFAEGILRDELEVLDDGRVLVYNGRVFQHNGVNIRNGVIEHYMFDLCITPEQARITYAPDAFVM